MNISDKTEGIYNLTVIGYDLVNNSATDSLLFTYDHTKPDIVDITGSDADDEYWIYFDIVESISTPVQIQLYVDEKKYLALAIVGIPLARISHQSNCKPLQNML